LSRVSAPLTAGFFFRTMLFGFTTYLIQDVADDWSNIDKMCGLFKLTI